MKEERTLFRYIALLAGCGLFAATVWIAHSTRAQEESADYDNPFAAIEAEPQQEATPRRSLDEAESNPFAAQAPAPRSNTAVAQDVLKRRVDDRMRQARRAYTEGDHQEALRLATAAQAIATQYQVSFAQGEQTPTELVSAIRERNTAAVAIKTPEIPSQEPEGVPEKQQYVKLLLSAAQDHLNEGNLEAARLKAMQAQAVDVPYGPFDVRPEHVLSRIEQSQPADPTGPTESFLADLNAKAVEPPVAPAEPAIPTETDPQAEARRLLDLARQAIDKEHYDEARSLALEARDQDATFDSFEDSPEMILSEIEQRTGTKIITASSRQEPEAEMTPEQALQTRGQASELVAEARKLLDAGDLEAARKKALEAQAMDATYALFDERPERILAAIQAIETNTMIAETTPGGSPPLPTHSLAPNSDKQEALSLLAQAKQDIQRGDLDAARQKAEAASRFDVTYNLFEETPEKLLQAIAGRAPAQSPAAASGSQTPAWAATAATESPAATTPKATPQRDPLVVTTAGGESARELYLRGIETLRQGNREGAYQLFLQAYNNGDELSRYDRQQLQDKLRALSPRSRSSQSGQIQQVSGEQLLAAPGSQPTLAESPLDSAMRQQSLIHQRAHTEVMNTVFRAERLRDSEPQQAVDLLNEKIAELEASELSPEQSKSLLYSLKQKRESIESYMAQRKPLLDLEQRNKETKDLIDRSMEEPTSGSNRNWPISSSRSRC